MLRLAGLASFFTLAASAAMAATVAADLSINGKPDDPWFEIENVGDEAITGFSFTIGDTAFQFDSLSKIDDGDVDGFTLNAPGVTTGGASSDLLDLSFSGFDAGDSFRFRASLSSDDGSGRGPSRVDFRDIFANNGAAGNSAMTLFFASGDQMTMELSDFNGGSIAMSGTALAVPLPASGVLLVGALAGLGLVRRRGRGARA